MLMTNDTIQLYPHDRPLAWLIVRFLPKWLKPNHLTVLRFCLTPCVLFLLWMEWWPWAFALFVFTAFTDALDGTMARTRKQITLWGTMADPIADKLLIGSVVVLFVAKEVNPLFAALIVFMEILIVAGAVYRKRRGIYSSANEYGKLKMLLQVVGVSLLLIAKLLGIHLVVPFAVGTLSLAIVFAIVSLLTYGF